MKTWFTAFRCFLAMTLLTGAIYPLGVTLVAEGFFPKQAAGSLISEGGRILGSELLAQKFSDVRYFWPRPSAVDYNPLPSGGSNLGPTSNALKDQWEARRAALLAADPDADAAKLPQELLAASGSGLDPDLSPEAIAWQAERVARSRQFTEAQRRELAMLLKSSEVPRTFGWLGEPRVNVLKLNKALDERFAGSAP